MAIVGLCELLKAIDVVGFAATGDHQAPCVLCSRGHVHKRPNQRLEIFLRVKTRDREHVTITIAVGP